MGAGDGVLQRFGFHGVAHRRDGNWVRGRSTEASPETTITMPRGGRLITSWTAQSVSTSVPDMPWVSRAMLPSTT